MKNVVVLGSTGSIGVNTLKVIKDFPARFKVIGLAANTNTELLKKQIAEFRPQAVCVADEKSAEAFCFKGPKLLKGVDGLCALASNKDADIIVVAVATASALRPLLAGIDAEKRIALANKEALVSAGSIVSKRLKAKGVEIIPVDSEHSAIFQCLQGHKKYLKNIYLTATGGPLRKLPMSKMQSVPAHEAIRHPKWSMGKKISVDSATMMNKGLEVIEARWLFGLDVENIKVLIHPQAIVHSMVEFSDGSVMAQMAVTDMRLPIQYALTYPERFSSELGRLDFAQVKRLDFAKPNFKKFPCLSLAYEAARQGGSMPAVLNAANEELVQQYLAGKIRLTDIAKSIEKVMKRHRAIKDPSLNEILGADNWARDEVKKCCQQ
jgi:1-deoxy-D-xylulose-5-phosphate reductoisomerase